MDYQQIAVGVHLIGFALGLGGATISDVTFFKAVRGKNLSAERYGFLDTLSRVIWAGIILLIISGLAIFALIYGEQGSLPMLASPRWQMKLLLVAVVFLNGLFFKFSIFPALKRLTNQPLSQGTLGPLINRLAASGTISILSWYSIFIITMLPRTFRPDLWYFIGVCLVLLLVGVLLIRTVLAKLVRA